jgi:hypothetical protein
MGSAEGHEFPDLQVGDEVNPRPYFAVFNFDYLQFKMLGLKELSFIGGSKALLNAKAHQYMVLISEKLGNSRISNIVTPI